MKLIDRFTKKEMDEIISLYQNRNTELILEKYKFKNKQQLYYLMSSQGIKCKNYYWTDEDIQILKDNYGIPYKELEKLLKNKYSIKAIETKAIRLGLTKPRDWTDEELNIIDTYYSSIPLEEFLNMLPGRTYNSIIHMAQKRNLNSYDFLQQKYSNEQKQFILNNYKNMTDQEIAEALNKPISGVQEQRRKLGIYYLNKDYSNYENFSKFFRGHTQDWKNASMKKCNYECVLTGSKNYEIHHLYGFNKIVQETFEYLDKSHLLKSDNLEDYSKIELDNILFHFNQIHNKYPLGICIDKKIHTLFHKIYGSGGNTELQWNQFKNDYINGKYKNNLIA